MVYRSKCPGAFVQDFSKNKFAVFIIASIDSMSYFKDTPILMRSLKPGFSENVDPNPKIYYENKELNLNFPEDISSDINKLINASEEMAETLKNLTADEYRDKIECPDPNIDGETTSEEIEIPITNDAGEIIQTVTTDLAQRETSNCSDIDTDEMIATIMNQIPDIEPFETGDDSDSVEKLICSLPESQLKNSILAATNGQANTIEEYQDYLNKLTDTLKFYRDDTWINSGLEGEEYNDKTIAELLAKNIATVDDITKTETPQYYGIPLIELDAGKADDGSEAIILQIDTENDWKLNIVNFNNLFDNVESQLELDVKVPPGTKFLAGFITDGVRHTLVYKTLAPGYDLISKTVIKPHNFTINTIGTDSRQLKNFCGYIYDIYVNDWATESDAESIAELNTLPPYPFGALAFYDFHVTRVIWNTVHERREMNKPLQIGGIPEKEWTLFSDSISKEWKFMQNGYLENFFCRKKFLNNSFSIVWYSWIPKRGTLNEYIISDDINDNYLYYNYYTSEFVIKFNSRTYKWFFYIPEKKWFQYSFRYDKTIGDLTIGVFDFESEIFFGETFNIGTDLEFELMSMLAKYNKALKKYDSKFECSFGALMLFDTFQDEAFLKKYLIEEKVIIEKLDPDMGQEETS